MQLAMVTSRRSFPRPLARRRRGIGQDVVADYGNYLGSEVGAIVGIDPVTGNYTFAALPNLITDSLTGSLSSNQLMQLQAANAAANLQAATNPITGQVNQSLLNQADTESAAGVGPAANVTGVNTGSWFANLADKLSGNYSGNLGLPGLTPSLGTPVGGGGTPPGTPIDWTSILEMLAIGGIVIVGAGYILGKL